MQSASSSRNTDNEHSEDHKRSGLKQFFEKFSSSVTRLAGRPGAFISALMMVIVWACCGPVFGFSETWQLVINTSTTIITFLMVFLIQQAQNKDTVALHLKLNELIGANKRASNRLINIEDMDEAELINLKNFFIQLSSDTSKDASVFTQHSIDEQQLKDTVEDIAAQLHDQIDPEKACSRTKTDIHINREK